MKLGPLELKHPVIPASGTYGRELTPFAPPAKLGAVVTRTITLHAHAGAPPPRLVETAAGLLSSTGYENPGLQVFLEEELPYWRKLDAPLIVSIAGKHEELDEMAMLLSRSRGIAAVELNLAPLAEQKALLESIAFIVRSVKQKLGGPLIVKLPPELEIARAARLCEEAGADILSLVNGFPGISYDRRSALRLGSGWGRLSGPAIKPLALKLVAQVCDAVGIPVIGMGGIFSSQDAMEFLQAGAQAVAVGTASLVNPRALVEIAEGLDSRSVFSQKPESRFQAG